MGWLYDAAGKFLVEEGSTKAELERVMREQLFHAAELAQRGGVPMSPETWLGMDQFEREAWVDAANSLMLERVAIQAGCENDPEIASMVLSHIGSGCTDLGIIMREMLRESAEAIAAG